MNLGTLIKYMNMRGIYSPRPGRPFYGFSVAVAVLIVNNFRSPSWCDRNSGGHRSCYPHDCSVMSEIKGEIASLKDSMQGLVLEDFPRVPFIALS
jgi:hypothetical protein